MNSLEQITIKVESGFSTGNVLALLYEIRHALERLVSRGEETVIDLRSIPLAPGEEAAIEQELSQGEVSVQINTLGISHINETAIPGVWLVTHFNSDKEVMGKVIEITPIPAIVKTSTLDMRDGLQRLDVYLAERPIK